MRETATPLRLPCFYTNPTSGIGFTEYVPPNTPLHHPFSSEFLVRKEADPWVGKLLLFQMDWIQKHLGLDVSGRVMEAFQQGTREASVDAFVTEHVYLYPPGEWNILAERLDYGLDNDAVTYPVQRIAVVQQNDSTEQMLADMGHELTHLLSGKRLMLQRDLHDYGEVLHFIADFSGYKGMRSGERLFDSFTEAVTELLHYAVLKDFTKGDAQREKALGYKYSHYNGEVSFITFVVEETAKQLRKSKREVLYALYSGYLQADHESGFADIRQVFGLEGVLALGRMDETSFDKNRYNELFGIFGINRVTFLQSASGDEYDARMSSFFDTLDEIPL